MEVKIADHIEKAQNGNADSLIELLEIFHPLLKKYGRLLFYEDAYWDLRVSLISFFLKLEINELRSKQDNVLISYIQSVVYHEHLILLKKNRALKNRYVPMKNIDTIWPKERQDNMFCNDFSRNVLFYDLSKYLTVEENNIILMLYWQGYTVRDICEIKHISRQTVNCTKRRAFRKIKAHYMCLNQ